VGRTVILSALQPKPPSERGIRGLLDDGLDEELLFVVLGY